MPIEREPHRGEDLAGLDPPVVTEARPVASALGKPARQSNRRSPRRSSPDHQPWTAPLVTAIVLVVAAALLFAFGLVLVGVTVKLAIPGTLLLVVGIMSRMLPGKPRGGGDEKVVLRLLRAAQAYFGGGGQH
ncbi:hypothetical protein [Nocardia sp. alder85J]|uniref:hypothetical protein n=1 Tax=Nocardia sp. alder85J TaxID=2862949 RepID=UPI001CD4881C|nr:hypothetical protein [Nocardia sp. alder85J]MCX4099236.1 hypothetical protein [Nocardia sp. alder85J]